MAYIAPSILSADFTKLGEEIRFLEEMGTKVVHVDIMDGHFVPNLTFGYTMVKALARYKGSMKFDVHLMMTNPSDYIEKFIEAGADMLTIHVECEDDIETCLRQIRRLGAVPGLSLKPKTPADEVRPYVGMFDQCLIMTVEPGFGGQKIIEKCLDKIQQVRDLCLGKQLVMAVDGGVNAENVRFVAEKGADLIVAGNAVLGAEDRVSAFNAMQSAVEG